MGSVELPRQRLAGLSGRQLIDAYKIDGTRLWRIDLGRNIRAGAHYTQFIVYDLDGDGRAEVACKTADGTVDGAGTVIGDATKDYRSLDRANRRHSGEATNDALRQGPRGAGVLHRLRRPTGARWRTTGYIPAAIRSGGWGGIGGNGNNDTNGNRGDRMLAGVAYLDGRLPSVMMARGYYGRSVLAAWDWRNGQLTSRWVFDSGIGVAAVSRIRPRRRTRVRATTTSRSPTSTATARTRSSTARWSSTTTARGCSRPDCATATRCTSAI